MKQPIKRKIYASNEILSIAQYLPSDTKMDYECWQETETQKGYNYIIKDNFDEFSGRKRNHRLYAAVTLNDETQTLIGFIMLSPPDGLPDLCIRILKAYHGFGYGSSAFALVTDYCVNSLGHDKIYAGCYETNNVSKKMLLKCGYVPHPDGDISSIDVFSEEKITQYDYVFENSK